MNFRYNVFGYSPTLNYHIIAANVSFREAIRICGDCGMSITDCVKLTDQTFEISKEDLANV